MSEQLENDIIKILREFSEEDGHKKFTSSQRMDAREIIQIVQLGGLDAFGEHYESIHKMRKELDEIKRKLNNE